MRSPFAPRGNFAIVEALTFEEHRALVNESSRFWDASGFSVNIGPAGAEIDFSSLATLVGGGITFDTFISGGLPVQDGTVFEIYPDKESARNSLFNASEVEPLKLSVVFDDNISGLIVGAPVELSGLKIGEVEALSGIVDYNEFGDSRVRLSVNLSIQPARLGLPDDVTAENALTFLQDRVANGLRARLASASLLTGGLKVELIVVDDAPAARLLSSDGGLPVIPTTRSETSDATATVEGVFTRINNLPIEELLNSAINFLDSAEAFVSDEDLRETPQDLRALLGELQGLVASDDVQNIPVALNSTLQRVEGLVADLEEQRITERLLAAIDGAAVAAESVSTSVEGLPQLIAQIDSLAAKAEALAVEELVTELTNLTRSADAVVAAPVMAGLPASLKTALDDVNAMLAELRQGNAIGNVNQTLEGLAVTSEELPQIMERLLAAVDSAANAADSVTSSVEGVPQLIEQIQGLASKAEALALDELLAELTELTRSADAVVGAPEAAQLPGSLKRALDEVNYTLQELREGGAIENVNQTLTSARNAADSIALSAKDLPQIVDRLTRLFAQASRTIEGYNKGDELSRTAESTLRDIQKAADALASLARTIERNPNSLLLGR